jgi:hypothetical protein
MDFPNNCQCETGAFPRQIMHFFNTYQLWYDIRTKKNHCEVVFLRLFSLFVQHIWRLQNERTL